MSKLRDESLLHDPLFFESNRVWRCYLGGALLDAFIGSPACSDGNFPEDWLASITRADNGSQQQSPEEGMSRIRGEGQFFFDLLQRYPAQALGEGATQPSTGVLCKLLDSAVRLPIQCHPDRAFARRHYNSEYGKTECWLILATREVSGEKPYLLMGFRPGVTQERFRRAVVAQDVPAMCGCLNKIEVKPGETYFIPGRMPHAIGPGVFLLEVQEPTDLVIQPERQIGAVTLTDQQMWGGLDPATAFSCFSYQPESEESLLSRLRLCAEPKANFPGGVLESIVNDTHTDCFQVDRLTVSSEVTISYPTAWHMVVVAGGTGAVRARSEHALRQGDSMFISNQIQSLQYKSEKKAPLVLYLISRTNKPTC